MRNSALPKVTKGGGTRTTAEANAKRNMISRKPYRTPEQKKVARNMAVKVNGTWVSKAPVSFSGKKKEQR